MNRIYYPIYWPTWLFFGILALVARVPYGLSVFIGKLLGKLFYLTAKKRRRIAEININLCFPQLNQQEQQQMVQKHFASLGISLLETTKTWFIKTEKLAKQATINGIEHIENALKQGNGVILLTSHFTTIEMGGKLMTPIAPTYGLYRPHKNPVFEHLLKKQRQTYVADMIDRKNMRAAINCLNHNNILWYAPDQDFGPKQSVFVNFFGIKTATLTATSRLAKLTNAKVIPLQQKRLADNKHYEITIHPPLDNFPTNDEVDCLRINQLIESWIKEVPEQYLWIHRRFKTRPSNEQKLY